MNDDMIIYYRSFLDLKHKYKTEISYLFLSQFQDAHKNSLTNDRWVKDQGIYILYAYTLQNSSFRIKASPNYARGRLEVLDKHPKGLHTHTHTHSTHIQTHLIKHKQLHNQLNIKSTSIKKNSQQTIEKIYRDSHRKYRIRMFPISTINVLRI